jgi:transposase-like protein
MQQLQRNQATLPESWNEKNETTQDKNTVREILKDLESISESSMEIECPLCFRSLQRYGRKVGPKSMLFQRFVCPDCRSAGRKYNYFLDIAAMKDCAQRSST